MQNRQNINASYYCGRLRPEGAIYILTSHEYVVAEYDQQTGLTRWQRVVPVNQKEVIQDWLREHYPAPAEKPKRTGRKKAAAAGAAA